MLKAPTAQQYDAATPDAEPSVRWLLAGLSLSMLLASLGASRCQCGLAHAGAAFGVSFQAVQWIVSPISSASLP